jgi:hypothetical protein
MTMPFHLKKKVLDEEREIIEKKKGKRGRKRKAPRVSSTKGKSIF